MRLLFSFCLLMSLFGCGGGGSSVPYTDTSKDESVYAGNVKQLVLGTVNAAKNSNEPGDLLLVIVSELEQTDRPRGKFDSVYKEILSKTQALIEEANRSGSKPAGLAKQLDELAKLAEDLPDGIASKPASGD